MKVVLLTVISNKEPWFQEARELYIEKINHFVKFELEGLKATKLERGSAERKIKAESEQMLKYLKPDDLVILLDEKGKSLSSIQFAAWLNKSGFESACKRMVFIIGGAFGVSSELKQRAQLTLQMGPWTLNHLVAQTVLLEQIYRALTIIKGLPYHNS
jgi:23S rRNA (pseudouridine1915-N3)-methyltransferase